jgi:hypothetical protein
MDYVPKIPILQHPFLITSLAEAMDNRQNIFRHVEAGKLWILSEETVRDEFSQTSSERRSLNKMFGSSFLKQNENDNSL